MAEPGHAAAAFMNGESNLYSRESLHVSNPADIVADIQEGSTRCFQRADSQSLTGQAESSPGFL